MQGRARGRRLIAPALVIAALLVGACGGDVREAAPEEPALPSALAEELATQADQVADTVAAGELCDAAQQADALAAAAAAAISSGQVPTAMQEELRSTVEVLVNEINCEEEDEDRGKGKGRGKGGGNGEGDD